MILGTAEAKPPTTVPVAALGELWVRWIYLIDPHAGTLTVLSTDDPTTPTAAFAHHTSAEDQR